MKLKVAIVFISLFILVGVASAVYLPYYLSEKVNLIKEACPKCELEFKKPVINIFSGTISAQGLMFKSDQSDDTALIVACNQLTIHVKPASLVSPPYIINLLEIDGLKVKVIEKHSASEPKHSANELIKLEKSYGGEVMKSLPSLEIKSLKLAHSQLDYVYKIFKKSAQLTVSEIDAGIESIATRPDLGPRFTDVNLTGKFQQSGHVSIKIKADLFSVKNDDTLEIEVKSQKLPELNYFFGIEDGVFLEGVIHFIRAKINLKSGFETGFLTVSYQGLKFLLKETPDRGLLKTAIAQFVQSSTLIESRPNDKYKVPSVPVSYHRKPGEGMIKYILGGLKEAAFKAISM
jgi:hypothetical protein